MTRPILAVAAALALAGCAAAPRAPEVVVPPDPAQWQQWTANGRLAVAAGGQGGSGSFRWRQDGAATQIDIRGPLGAGALHIVATPGTLRLADGAGRVLDAGAAQMELQARLGADLPWASLRYWMLGLAAPDEPATVTDAAGSPPRVIEQSGWRIAYETFLPSGGVALPQRFTARREAVRVKVVVDEWRPGLAVSPSGDGNP